MYQNSVRIQLQSLHLNLKQKQLTSEGWTGHQENFSAFKSGYSERPELLSYSSIPYGDEECISIRP